MAVGHGLIRRIQRLRTFGKERYSGEGKDFGMMECNFRRYTMQEKAQKVYAIVLRYPESNAVDLQSIREFVTEKTKVKLLGYEKEIEVSGGGIIVVWPD